MADIHSIIRSLKSKSGISESFSSYGSFLSEKNYRQAQVGFAYQYLTLYESYRDSEEGVKNPLLDETSEKVFAELNALVDQGFPFTSVSSVKASELRKVNADAVNKLTALADLYVLNEYTANREEHLFVGEKHLPEGYSDMQMTDEVINFLARFKKEEQNLLIVRLISELPVRMTKVRFFDLVRDSLGIYKGSDLSSFKDVLDVIRSGLGLFTEAPSDEKYDELFDLDRDMRKIKQSELTEEIFQSYLTILKKESEYINDNTDFGRSLQDALNSCLIMALCSGISEKELPVVPEAVKIVKSVRKLMESDVADEELLAVIYEACEELEGVQEELLPDIQEGESFLPTLAAEYEETLMEDAKIRMTVSILSKISVLHSQSPFVDPDAEDKGTGVVTEDILQEETARLIESLKARFEGSRKEYVRAMMGRFISILPPRFTSQEELENYFYNALSGCSSEAEKLGCIEVMRQIMED